MKDRSGRTGRVMKDRSGRTGRVMKELLRGEREVYAVL